MGEILQESSSEKTKKLKSEKSKELLERYENQRKEYYKTKNKNDHITEEQRKIIDAEMDAKIDELYNQEKSKKRSATEAPTELTNIEDGLNSIDTGSVENIDIQNFEFNNNIGFGSVQAIKAQAELYVAYNKGIHQKAEELSMIYNKFTQVVNRFNEERENDTRRSGDSEYEKYVDEINQRIETYKQMFKNAEAQLTAAIRNSDKAGQRLNEAPDDLRKTEGTNQTGTEGEFKQQQDQHVGQIQAYTEQGQKLDSGSQQLDQTQSYLKQYGDQLVQVTDTLTVKKTEIERNLLERDSKKQEFRNKINALCSASNVAPFTDEELRSLLNDPESFIRNLAPQERGQAALNIIQGYNQELAEYLQAIDNYNVGVSQRDQIAQGIVETEDRQKQITESQQNVASQQEIINNEIISNNARIENVKGEMSESKDQHEQSLEYYQQNMDDIDKLDYEMSSIILDNDLSNSGILESVANQRKSFDGMKVSKKGGWEKARDSTIGMVGKGLRNYVLEPLKDALLYLPNLAQELGEKNPKIGESWLFKVINTPLQIQAGITEGVIELTEGLIQMCEQPMATLEGLGQLIGRDAITGERSLSTAGDSRTNFGKALIAYDERGEGNDGRALGKGIANIGTLLIPFAGEAGAAANTAKVARAVGNVSKTRAALIGTYDFTTRVGSKIGNGVKGLGKGTWKTVRHPVETVKGALRGTVEKGKTVAGEVREAGGVTNYAKQGLNTAKNTVSDAYHNAGGVKGITGEYVKLSTGYTYAKGAYRLIKGEPLFGKRFPSLKKLHTERIKMEERLQKLRGPKGQGGEIEAMYEKVSKYVDKNGDLLEGVVGKEIPMKEWGNIADYQSALQEVRALEATIAKYKDVETSLVDESGNPTKLGKFIQENKNFGKTMEKMLADPEKAQEIFAEFKKKNPKIDLGELEDIELFRDGGKIYRIKNGELIEGEGMETGRIIEGEGMETGRIIEGEGIIEGTKAEARETEIGQRTVQDIFNDVSTGKITVKEAKYQLSKAVHPDVGGTNKLFTDAMADLEKIKNGVPEFERTRDWSKVPAKPKKAGAGANVEGAGAEIEGASTGIETEAINRPRPKAGRNDQYARETLNLYKEGDVLELYYKEGKGPLSERWVKEKNGYRKLEERGGKYERTETLITEDEMVIKMRDVRSTNINQKIRANVEGAGAEIEGASTGAEAEALKRPKTTEQPETELKSPEDTFDELLMSEQGVTVDGINYRLEFENPHGKTRIKLVMTKEGKVRKISVNSDSKLIPDRKSDGIRIRKIIKQVKEEYVKNYEALGPRTTVQDILDQFSLEKIDFETAQRELTEALNSNAAGVESTTLYKDAISDLEKIASGEHPELERSHDWSKVPTKPKTAGADIEGTGAEGMKRPKPNHGEKDRSSRETLNLYNEGDVIELHYKVGKGPGRERWVKEKNGYRKLEERSGKYERTETLITEDEMVTKMRDVRSTETAGAEVEGAGTEAEAINGTKPTEQPRIGMKTMKNSEIHPNYLQEGDLISWDGHEIRITKRIEGEGGKISYDVEFNEGGNLKTSNFSAEELAGDRKNISNIRRPQIKGMNDYFKENVASCEGKKLYFDGNEYTATVDRNGTLHLRYTGGHEYPIRYEIGKDGKMYQVKHETLQNDITVSSFDQLTTRWNASPIDDGRALSGKLKEGATKLTEAERSNIDFWNRLIEGEKEWTRTTKTKLTETGGAPEQGGTRGVTIVDEQKGVVPQGEGTRAVTIVNEQKGVVPTEKPGITKTKPEIKAPLIPDVPLRVSAAAVAILANKEEKLHIDVPGTTGFERTAEDQKEVVELQELLSKNPTPEEIKNFIRNNKDSFKKLVLVKDGENGGCNVNFDILNYLTEQGMFDNLNGNIKEQLKYDIIKYIGLGDLLEEGTTFTVTSVDGTKRSGKVINNRAVDENGKYIPIFQGDHIESDALGFLDQIYPEYTNNKPMDELDPDAELDIKLEGMD